MDNDLYENLRGSYVVVRSNEAGVFSGLLQDTDGTHVLLVQSIKAWQWEGALCVQELALFGPTGGKISHTAQMQTVSNTCEVVLQTQESRDAFESLSGKYTKES